MSNIINYKFINDDEKDYKRTINIINKYYETLDENDKKEADRQVGWELISLSLKIRLKLPEDMQRAAQMGFCIINYKFKDDENVIEYFAIKMLDIIMNSEGIHLENNLHNNFNNKEEVIKKGINTILLELVGRNDYYLKEYLLTNLHLLKDYYKNVEQILDKWDEYISDDAKKMIDYNGLNILIDQFIKKYPEFIFKRDVVAAYIEKNFDLSFEDYYGYNRNEIYKDLNFEPIDYDKKISELTLKEQHTLLELKNVVLEFLKTNNKNEFYGELLSKTKRKNKK